MVKFWKFDEAISNIELNPKKDWLCFKTMQLQSRVANLKFDDKYMVASTYFLTIDLYSLLTNQLLYQYMGHTCSISSFDFNQNLMLIVTGSADNSIKYWSMYVEEIKEKTKTANPVNINNANILLIKTEQNLIWPVHICIQNYKMSDQYLLMVLLANGYLFINNVERFDDFALVKSNSEKNHSTAEFYCADFDRFNFKFKLRISSTFKSLVSLYSHQSEFNLNNSNSENFFADENSENLLVSNKSWIELNNIIDDSDKIITVYVVSENNSNQTKKFFIKKWLIRKNDEYEMFDMKQLEEEYNLLNDSFAFLNKRSLKSIDINQFEIVSFGSRY